MPPPRRRRLSELAYDLGRDPDTLRRHMASLQASDAITQGQLAVAEILRSDAPVEDRTAAVTLEEMRDSLAGRLLADPATGGPAGTGTARGQSHAEIW